MTDKLAVFEGNVLTDDEMKSLVGVYRVVAPTGGNGKERPKEKSRGFTLEVSKKDKTYHFTYGSPKWSSSGRVFLSRIPDSKKNLLLFASPEVQGKGPKGPRGTPARNVCFVVHCRKDTIKLWAMSADQPMVKNYSFTQRFQQDVFKAAELKEFLRKHADEFVEENLPTMTFKRTG
jgi:hypothetical protein